MEGEHHSGALFGPGKAGEWDASGCAHARAMVAAPRDLRMFYASPDAATGAWAIGAARSADGLAWKKAGVFASAAPCTASPRSTTRELKLTTARRSGRVFERGPPGAWDAGGVTAPHVHRTGAQSWVMCVQGLRASSRRTDDALFVLPLSC